jgi:hypothetical protein
MYLKLNLFKLQKNVINFNFTEMQYYIELTKL